MDLKKTMLLAVVGALTACEHQAVNGHYETMTSKSMDLSQSDKQHMKFLKNYNRLYHEVDGAWFSFGDEKQLRKSLLELKQVSKAREIISQLPERVNIGSTYFLMGDLAGGYVSDDASVNVDSSSISQEKEKRAKGQLITAEVLFHELFHANQDECGLIVLNNASMEEIVVSQRLIEAEAHAWTNVLHEMRKASANDTYQLSQEDINRFMKKDLITAEQEKLKKEGNGDMSSRYREYFKKESATYCFQQSLIACRGDLEKACHHMAAQRMRYFLSNQDADWTNSYHQQAVRMIKKVAKEGLLSQNGNQQAYDNMLAYYAKTYGLSSKEMQQVPLTTNLLNGLQEVTQKLNTSRGWIEDKNKLSMDVSKSYTSR